MVHKLHTAAYTKMQNLLLFQSADEYKTGNMCKMNAMNSNKCNHGPK